MYQDSNPKNLNCEAVLLVEIWPLLAQLLDRGEVFLEDALTEATAAVREQASRLRWDRQFHEVALEPMAKKLAAITDIDIETVRAVGEAVMIPSRAAVMLEVLRAHVAPAPKPAAKTPTPAPSTARRRTSWATT